MAAVLGAAVGALGTGGAAFATGWWGVKQAKFQISTQDSQSRRQLRFNHLSERRGTRSAAYVEYISQAQNIRRKFSELAPLILVNQTQETAEAAAALEEESKKMQELATRVCVEGPASIVEPAQRLQEAAGQCSMFCLVMHMENSELKRSGTAPTVVAQIAMTLSNTISSFTESARISLDEDISGHGLDASTNLDA